MRRSPAVWICAAAVAALAACGRPADPAPTPEEPPLEAGVSPAMPEILGMYEAVSGTAMAITGEAEIDEAKIVFAHGLTYATAVLQEPALEALAGKDGDTLRMTLGLEAQREVQALELRKVTEVEVLPMAPNAGLCGEQAATHLVLAVSPVVAENEAEGPQYLWLAAFTGADAPGPDAADSALCGTFLFAREIAS